MDKKTYKFDAVVRETEKAILLRFGDDDKWFPKSQVEFDVVTRELDCPDWLAKDKEIEYYVV